MLSPFQDEWKGQHLCSESWQIVGKWLLEGNAPIARSENDRINTGDLWWALVDDLRTLPLGQIVAGIPHIGELSLL